MTQETEFTTADFVILKNVIKMKNNKLFVKKEKIFLHRQSLADTSYQFSNLPRHLRRYLS